MNSCKQLAATAALLAIAVGPVQAQDAAESCMAHALAILGALDSGKFEDARRDFDATMQAELKAEQLRAVWESLPAQAGARLAVRQASTRRNGDIETVVIPIQHEKTWLELQISCAGDGRVNGLFVRPGKEPFAAQAAAPIPAYVDVTAFNEREINFESDGLTLTGTLSLPSVSTPVPGIVLVHGSGPHDRDESISGNKPFRDLAQGLASRGIAVLRYEKRSKSFPQSFAGKTYTVREEVVSDAIAAMARLRTESAVNSKRVFVLGHSLGAMLAPRIAFDVPELAGMILLAAPARGLADMIPFQLEYLARLDGSIDAQERKRISEFEAVIAQTRALDEADRADPTPLLGAPAAYWLDLANYKPITQTARLARPTLLLQGEGDYQVTMKQDFAPWVKALAKDIWFTSQSFPGLGHLFTPAGDPPSPADYDKPANVDVAVIDAIEHWIKAQSHAESQVPM